MILHVFDNLEQGTDEWLEARCGLLSASTIGQLITPKTLKVARNDTARALIGTLAVERITGRVEYVRPTRDMERGTLLEPHARNLYAEHYAPVTETGGMKLTPGAGEHNGLWYSPDGLVGDDGLIEIKSRKPRVQLQTIVSGRVPDYNMAQLQTGLFVSGRAWIDYVSYSPGMPLYTKRVCPKTEWQDVIKDAWDEAEHLIDIYTEDYRAMMEAYKHPDTEWFDPFEQEEIVYG